MTTLYTPSPEDRVLTMVTEINFTLRHNRTMPLQTATLLRTLRNRLMSDYETGKAKLACRGLAFLTTQRLLNPIKGVTP